MHPITPQQLSVFRAAADQDRAVRTLHAAAAQTELSALAYIPAAAARLKQPFALELKTRGITAQRKSGRCWLFAAMNIAREIAADRLGLDEFVLSGNFLAFYDKLEKANNFLEMILASTDEPLTGRRLDYILHGFTDGGYWDMAVDLIRKYGVVPAAVFPETFQSENTDLFTRKELSMLRRGAARLRDCVAGGDDPAPIKEEILTDIYKAECIVFGQPPERFDYSWRDKEGVFHEEKGITPQEFYGKYIGLALEDYVTVTNHPTAGLPMDYHYIFHYIGCMAEGNVRNLNLTMNELTDLCLKQLRGGEPVWFGCDAGAFGNRPAGVWAPECFAWEDLLGGAPFTMEKGERLMYRDSFATHAMILVGADFDEAGRPTRWKIENSWGADVGDKGYFVCSQTYFDEYVYEAIIHKKYLSEKQLALWESEPTEIEPWLSDCL